MIMALSCLLLIGIYFIFGRKILLSSTLPAYRALISNYNRGLENRIIGLEDAAIIKIPAEVKSLEKNYQITGAIFKPVDSSLRPFFGNLTQREWGNSISGDMKKFKVRVEINIPEEKILEGKTVEGILEAEIVYPAETKSGIAIIPGEFANLTKVLTKSISIHIFKDDERKQLEKYRSKINKHDFFICLSLILAFLALLFIADKID